MKELQQDTRLTLLSRLPVMLLSFIAMTLLTRWLGPEGNGVYTFLFTNVNLFLLLFGLQTDTAALHYMAREDVDNHKIVSIWMLLTGISLVVFTLIVIFGGGYIPAVRKILLPEAYPMTFFLWFMLLSFLFRKVQNFTLVMSRANLQFRRYTRLQFLFQLIPAILYGSGFAAALWMPKLKDISVIFNFILLAQMITAVAGVAIAFAGWKFKPTHRVESHFRRFLSFSAKSAIDGLAKFINRRIDIYFVQAFRGVSPLGQYGLAAQINNFAQEAILPITQVTNPYLVKSDEAGKKEMISRMSRIVFVITLCMGLAIAVAAPLIIPILFGKSFAGSIVATQILALSTTLNAMRLVFSGYFLAINQLQYNIRSNWLGVLATLVLDILLIPKWGIEGASTASVIAYLLSLLYIMYHFIRKTGMPVSSLVNFHLADLQWLMNRKKNL